MGIFSKPANFLSEVRAELLKVSWSTRQELIGSTFVVMGVTALMAVYVGIIDVIITKFLTLVLR
jgi:preprotein translocase subunit SecE